jgi:metal-responsive CopG/Arc/MetJ family transcriptional regulator
MADPDVQGKADLSDRIDEAVGRGEYPDRKAAIAGLMKQLIDYQKGMLKGQGTGNPVAEVEKIREEKWNALLEKAGGDDEKAARMYVEEIRKISQ